MYLPSETYDSQANPENLVQTIIKTLKNRELIILLVKRDLKSRYSRSFLGLIWTLVNPILSSFVMWAVFVSIFKTHLSNGTQFAPYLLAGVLTVNFFNQGFIQAAESISSGNALFLKIRVDPRVFVFASSLSNSVNFSFGLVALLLVSMISGAAITPMFPAVILVGICLTMLTSGLGLMFSILFVRFDDMKYIVTILLQLLTYLTPIFYPKEMLPSGVRILVGLNPLTSYLDVFRHAVNGTEIATIFDWFYMFGSATCAILLGLLVFQKTWKKTVVMM